MAVSWVTSSFGQSADAILDLLLRKGIITQQELNELRDQVDKDTSQTIKREAYEGNDLKFSWKDGINIQSADGKTFKGKIGGRIQWDMAAYSQDDDVQVLVGDIPAAAEFRRVRLSTEGEYATSLPAFYKLELDFAGSEVAFKDVYLGVKKIPYVGSIQAGHFKEPIGLEVLTSSRFITFMERALPMEAFAPERNTGIMLSNHAFDERMTWALGGFTDVGDDAGGTLDSDFRVSARITGLPWYDKESKGAKLLHLGVSGSIINPQDDMVRFRSRPESHLAPRFVDTGAFASDEAYLFGGEAALILGPFSLQGEYLHTCVDVTGGDEASFDGFYVFGSWFLTGEHREYKRSSAAFDRVRPKKNFGLGAGGRPGAWELALRYSHLDLNDEGIKGGQLSDVTAGVNWYLNPNLKLMFNYVFAQVNRNGLDGDAHVFQTRFGVDF